MSAFLSSVKNFVQSPTELKVRQATDENETFGATGTLMNEISVLTYSSKTLKEIIQVVRKKLLLGYNKRTNTHKNCIILLKTLTLVSYLMNNGSNEFISWVKSNIDIFEHLNQITPRATDRKNDTGMVNQISVTSKDITMLINDDELLEQRRRDVIQFRSSISSPGRKSTDNSHLKNNDSSRSGPEKYGDPTSSPRVIHSGTYQRVSHSLDLQMNNNPLRNTGEYSRTALDPLREEDTGETSALNDLRGIRFNNEIDANIDELSRTVQEVNNESESRFRSRFKNIPFV